MFLLTTLMLILLPEFLCTAQITKKQAITIVMQTIVGERADSVNVFMEPNIQTSSYYVLCSTDSIPSPFTPYWIFFIDLKPLYGWGHSCEFVFINESNGDTSIVMKQFPPYRPDTTLLDVSVPFQYTITPPNFDVQNSHLPYPSGNPSLYAVMFTGGDPLGNGAYSPAFWNALSHRYCGLREHGFSKNHIKVLSYSGKKTTHFDQSNPSLDLDNDSISDILQVPCTRKNIDSIFSILANTMTSRDMLYVFVTTHGIYYPSDTSKVYFKLYGQDSISNYQFADAIEPIHCAQKILGLYKSKWIKLEHRKTVICIPVSV